MRLLNCGLLATSLILSTSLSSRAGSIYFAGDLGMTNQSSGTIQVLLDLEPGHTFHGGGIFVDITNDNPTAFSFTDAAVANRWDIAHSVLTPNTVQLFGSSVVISSGLSPGAQGVLFATINWQRYGVGRSNLAFALQEEAFVNGPFFNETIVTENYMPMNNFLESVPEPKLISMTIIIAMGLVLRRGGY